MRRLNFWGPVASCRRGVRKIAREICRPRDSQVRRVCIPARSAVRRLAVVRAVESLEPRCLLTSFHEASSLFASSHMAVVDVPLEIAAGDLPQTIDHLAMVRSQVEVHEVGRLVDVQVTLDIDHTFTADLTATLIGPSGIEVELFRAVGGNGDDFLMTTFSDHAEQAIETGQAPFVGSFRPAEALARLIGSEVTGMWTLEIEDHSPFDEGILGSWTLQTLVRQQPDLTATAFDVAADLLQSEEVTVDWTLENLLSTAAGPFQVAVVLSADEMIGDAEDWTLAQVDYAGLEGQTSLNDSTTLMLDLPRLYAMALQATPPGRSGTEQVSGRLHLGIVIDPLNEVAEADETNNAGQGQGIDFDQVTYFPWDLDGDRVVELSDAMLVAQHLGTTDPADLQMVDLNGDGLVSPTDVIAVFNRVGYRLDESVFDDQTVLPRSPLAHLVELHRAPILVSLRGSQPAQALGSMEAESPATAFSVVVLPAPWRPDESFRTVQPLSNRQAWSAFPRSVDEVHTHARHWWPRQSWNVPTTHEGIGDADAAELVDDWLELGTVLKP